MGIDPEGAYLQNPQANLKSIETVIDAAIKEGIYVIIDWHAHKIHTKKRKNSLIQYPKNTANTRT
jgi:endoglucanase